MLSKLPAPSRKIDNLSMATPANGVELMVRNPPPKNWLKLGGLRVAVYIPRAGRDSERFRSVPRTCRPLCGRLSVRETGRRGPRQTGEEPRAPWRAHGGC